MIIQGLLVKTAKENQRMIDALKAFNPTALKAFGVYHYEKTVNVPAPTTTTTKITAYSLMATFSAQNINSPCLSVSVSATPVDLSPTSVDYYSVCQRNSGQALRRKPQTASGKAVFISDINYVAADVAVQAVASEPGELTVEVIEESTTITT